VFGKIAKSTCGASVKEVTHTVENFLEMAFEEAKCKQSIRPEHWKDVCDYEVKPCEDEADAYLVLTRKPLSGGGVDEKVLLTRAANAASKPALFLEVLCPYCRCSSAALRRP
jgi:hypothetical protein